MFDIIIFTGNILLNHIVCLKLRVNSMNSMTGHLLGAAGAVEVVTDVKVVTELLENLVLDHFEILVFIFSVFCQFF